MNKYIDKNDAIKILDVTSHCLQVKDLDTFKNLVYNLQDFFPHTNSFCTFVNLKELAISNNPAIEMVDINYPTGLLDYYFEMGYNANDPVIKELMSSLTIQNWNLAFKKNGVSYPDWIIDGNIGNGYSSVTIEPNFLTAATFSFSGVSSHYQKRTEAIITYLTPHLSEALKRSLGIETVNNIRLKSILTNREIEVLNWLKQGKSSWDISVILNISERTANFHANNIVKKLNVSNRTHAVAIAYNLGIVQLD